MWEQIGYQIFYIWALIQYKDDILPVRPSYLHNGISYTGKMTSLYWIRALVFLETG